LENTIHFFYSHKCSCSGIVLIGLFCESSLQVMLDAVVIDTPTNLQMMGSQFYS
jgi:hypothetical protein